MEIVLINLISNASSTSLGHEKMIKVEIGKFYNEIEIMRKVTNRRRIKKNASSIYVRNILSVER